MMNDDNMELMSNVSSKLNINPQMLKWVKLNYGLHDEQMATKMKVALDRYVEFEDGEAKPTINQLRSLASQVKVPVSMFYLKKQPGGIPFPDDYRNKSDERPLSIKARLSIRRATAIQSFLNEIEGWGEAPRLEKYKSNNTQELAQILRSEIQYDPEQSLSRDHLHETIRDYLESLNLVVLELPMPSKELRGFSLYGKPTIIATSIGDAVSGRIFTLLHEFAHVIKHKEGMCQPFEKHPKSASTELFCNQFAADFIITDQEFDRWIGSQGGTNDERLQDLADIFKTSREVILIKMIEKGVATWATYFNKKKKWQAAYDKEEHFYNQPNPIKRTLKENGKKYTSEVFEQLRADKISYSEAADRLALNVNYLDMVGEKLGDGK